MSSERSPSGSALLGRTLHIRILAYLLAILLPTLSSALIARSPLLLTIPFSLYFISISIIAVLGGLSPALVSVLFCVLSRRYFIAPGEPLLAFNSGGLYRLFVLFACALLISGMDRYRRTAAYRLELALDDLHERTNALVDSLQNAKCASWSRDFSRSANIRWYSGSYQIYGRAFPENQDQSAFEAWLHPDDRPGLNAFIDSMRTTPGPLIFEYRVIWPNGETHWLEARATRVPGPANLWRGLTVDITERKLTESTLLRSEKLAAMGRLASTVAHEINNPLESVTNLLYLARMDDDLSPSTRAYLTTAEQELARLGDITRLTLGFVRSSATRGDLAVAAVVQEVLSIFRHRLESKSIAVVRDFQPGVRIHIAAHELRQILTNLISNAADALGPQGGCIHIHITAEGNSACLRVEDNGCGIPPEALPRIFEPFFTTKEDVGTGIGLWVTRELIENNRGKISVESGALPDQMRTRFRITLPLAQPSQAAH
jgi:signal transduction histidine kinase